MKKSKNILNKINKILVKKERKNFYVSVILKYEQLIKINILKPKNIKIILKIIKIKIIKKIYYNKMNIFIIVLVDHKFNNNKNQYI